MKRRALLCRFPAWLAAPGLVQAQNGPSLFSYGPDLTAMWQRALQTADQVLRGRPVGGMPFEQPTRISLTLNQATASSFGLTSPRKLLLRADEVIG